MADFKANSLGDVGAWKQKPLKSLERSRSHSGSVGGVDEAGVEDWDVL